MRAERLLKRVLKIEKAVLLGVEWSGLGDEVVFRVRRRARAVLRCGQCQQRCGRYDEGSGTRRWRSLDLGLTKVFIEAKAPRVRCAEHGVVVAEVPWARHKARFTREFDDQLAWLAIHTDRTAAAELMRVSWRSTGAAAARVWQELDAKRDRLEGLTSIGIDEVSYRKGHKYLTVVVDNRTGKLVWAAEGRTSATVEAFLDALGPQRVAQLRFVSTDAANWIVPVIKRRCPKAVVCTDPFHVAQWASKALDEVRREQWRRLRKQGKKAEALKLQRSRYALWKDPSYLTHRQRERISSIQRLNKSLYRAYLLKEQLRQVLRTKGRDGVLLLNKWLAWASRCKLKAFVELGKRIRRHRADIDAALMHRVSNARSESANTRIRLLTRLAFGFHSPQALIGLAMLKLSGLTLRLPGRGT